MLFTLVNNKIRLICSEVLGFFPQGEHGQGHADREMQGQLGPCNP